MPFADEEVTLGGLHVAVLTGQNGAGKSSILDAITWALWGKARGDGDEDRIRMGANEASVELTYEADKTLYRVTRTKKRGKGKASGQTVLMLEAKHELGISWENISGATIKETQQAIVGTIKMDYQTFTNSVFLRQGHADEFTTADPAQRKQVLINILSLEEYEALEKQCKGHLAIIGQNVSRLEATVKLLQEEIEQAQDPDDQAIDEIKNRLVATAKEKAKIESELRELQDKLAAAKPTRKAMADAQAEAARLSREDVTLDTKLQEAKAKVSLYQSRLASKGMILESLKKLEDAEKESMALAEKARVASEMTTKIARLEQTIRDEEYKLRTQHHSLSQQLKGLKSASPEKCPTCGSQLNADKIAEIDKKRDDLTAQIGPLEARLVARDYAKPQWTEIEALQPQREALQADIVRLQEITQNVNKWRPAREHMKQISDAESKLPEAEKLVKEHETALADLVMRRLELNEKIKGLSDSLPSMADLERNISACQNQLYQAQKDLECDQADLAAFQERQARIAGLKPRLEENQKTLTTIREREGLFKELAAAFNKAGIPSEIIKTAIPEVEAEANRLLGDMTDGRMGLALVTQRDNKSGTVTETLDIVISDELGARPYEMYSGGEAFKINLALRLALSRLVANRAGAPMSCLFIDEGFGSQDAAGLTKVVEAINSIKGQFKLILVVTHLEELKDAFGSQIVVTKAAKGSKVEVK